MARRPSLLVLNQYYWPGVEASAHLLTELCEGLAEECDVTVITGRLRASRDAPRSERRNGVRILRVRSTAYDRAPIHARATNYITYLGLASLRAFVAKRPDLVLCMTDPPVVGDLALLVARRFRAPLVVISEDVFPEVAVALARLENPLLVGLLRALTDFYLRRADRVVAIGDTMKQRLAQKGVDPHRVRVIPNWADTASLRPQPRDNDWARAHDLVDFFVVMHSGNVGHAQSLDTLIRATTFLRDIPRLRVAIAGFGARHAELVALANRLDSDAVRFLPYQPRELLPRSLSSADVHFVGLGRGLSGYVVPSRVYGILAAGRPVLVAADAESEISRLVQDVGCGLAVEPDRPDLVATALRELHSGEHDLQEMGRRGREYAESEADRAVAIANYRELIAEMTG